jgi:putative flippase GtrA
VKALQYTFLKLIVPRVQLGKFALVGSFGFLIDSGVLYLCLYLFGMGYYQGRLVSYLCATTVTWYFHRIYTFKPDNLSNKKKQLVSFVFLNSLGGVANYVIYALLISNYEIFRIFPVAAVGIGALFGLVVNYSVSKNIVFRN